tara:strand:- start:119 stop:2125 length:2007 start_codon:yes stop_codon:yes gene_type:complete
MINKLSLSLLAFLFCMSCFSQEKSEDKTALQLNALFSDHMVLQQNTKVAFWGTYTPNKKLTISASWGKKTMTIADAQGHWKLNLETPKAGGPFKVEIETDKYSKILTDIMIGEVWLASGQSNMEMTLRGWPPNDIIDNSEEEIAKADYPEIRMFTVRKQLSLNPEHDLTGNWEISKSETAGRFSASAYFFARKLHKTLNVPIGIIHSSWGGTPAESWTSNQVINEIGDFDDVLKELDDISDYKEESDWFSKWETATVPLDDKGWDKLTFYDNELKQIQYNDSKWDDIYLPGRFDDIVKGDFDGVMWFRKIIHIKNIDLNYTLSIGAIDDMDVIYINGQKIGSYAGISYANTKRTYKIPKSFLNKGDNTIAIRAIDVGGPGLFKGPMVLDNQTGSKISLSGSWKSKIVAEIYKNKFYFYGINKLDLSKRVTIVKLKPGTPSVLYNAMIHPLIPYTIRGAIWYQGESNVGRAEQYQRLFPAMIKDWRAQWNYDFPFYFVQIAPYQYHRNKDVFLDQSQKLREAQRHALKTKNTGMVVTLDIGNFNNIHPSNKQDIGKRLAGLALANDYGEAIVSSGPLYRSYKKVGQKLILNFDYTGSGLMAKGDLLGFEIAGDDKKYVFANAKIVKNKIELSAGTISEPIYVRYGWKDKAVPSLFNIEGLPASSFTSEK